MSLLALIRMPGFVSWGVWSRKVVVKFYSALGTDLVWCQDNRFFWSQSSVLWECWVRTVRWGELREEQGSLFLIMKILAVIAYKTSHLKCSCSSLVTEDQRESLPVEWLAGHYTMLPFRDQGITSLPAGWASRSLATSLAVLLLRENERVVFHSSDRFNFCNVGTMKWMQTSHLYPLWCDREQSNLGVESSIMLNIFSEGLFSKDTGKCMFVSVSFPLQVPCWESLSQPSCRAARGCLQYLCVSGLLAHLERILIGEFPILVSWRNLQVDFEILQRIIFYSLYRFFKFDSITLKFLFTFVHKLNFTITLLIKQQWSGLVCKQKHLIRKNPEALIWISWFFICIALNFVSLDLFLLFIGNASILLPFCKNENFVESVWVCTHKYVLEYIYMCIACAVVESLCLIILDPSVTEQLKYRKVAEKKNKQ